MDFVLVFGGESSEHDVSIKSFLSLYELISQSNTLKSKLKDVFYINREGLVRHTSVDYKQNVESFYEGDSNISIYKMFEMISADNLFLFSTIHGQYGEDGSLQGAVKLFKIKSNLGSVFSTSISMSKHHINQYVENKLDDLIVPKSLLLCKNDKINLDEFNGSEIIVKPNAMGSSLFTEKFFYDETTQEEVENLINKIFEFDEFALIQEFIEGDEFSCGCLEKSDSVVALPIVQIDTGDEFFSHEAKYKKGISTNNVIPVNKEQEIHRRIKNISLELFRMFNYHSMVRFDYLVREDKIYFLEANIIPGLKSS